MKEIKDIKKFIEDNNIGRIFLDIDGVVLSSCQALVDILNKKNGTNFSGEDVLSWNFKEIQPNITDEQVEKLFADPIFFEYVKPIQGALEFIKDNKDKITFVTKATFDNYRYKIEWFSKNKLYNLSVIALPLDTSKNVIGMSKEEIGCNTLFIDDSTKNLDETNATYKIQFREYKDDKKREWQVGWNGRVMYNW